MTRLHWAGIAVLGLAGAVAPAPAVRAAEDPSPATSREVCAPVAPDRSSLPDLQQLTHAACEALWGDARAGVVSEQLRLRVGGWIDASYQDNDLRADDYSLALNHVNLHFDARWAERWQVFVEGEYEYEPELTGLDDDQEWELEQLWAQYAHDDWLRLRAGRFSTPFGYWTPVHWSILVDTIEAPIHEANRSVPEQQIGAGLFGRWFAGPLSELTNVDSELEYAVYAGYAEDGFDAGKPNGLTLGGDLRLRLAERYGLGVSLYTQENGEEADRREHSLMLYGEAHLPLRLLARAEYLYQHRSGRTRDVFVRDVDIVYAKLRWDFRSDAYLNYRFEFGEDDRYGFTVDRLVNRFTAGYRPIPRLVLKAEYARHELSSRVLDDYHFWGLSAGLFF